MQKASISCHLSGDAPGPIGAPINVITSYSIHYTKLYDTLVDSAPQLHGSVVAALAALGKGPVTLAQVSAWIGNGADMLLRRAWQGQHEVDATPPAELPALRAAFDADYAEAATQGVSLYPGVQETRNNFV